MYTKKEKPDQASTDVIVDNAWHETNLHTLLKINTLDTVSDIDLCACGAYIYTHNPKFNYLYFQFHPVHIHTLNRHNYFTLKHATELALIRLNNINRSVRWISYLELVESV